MTATVLIESRRESRARLLLRDPSIVIAGITVVLFLFAAVSIPNFATPANIQALFLSVSLVGIVAVGVSVITIVGKLFSLAISATAATASILFASFASQGVLVGLAVAVGFGAITGLVQGWFVGKVETDPIVTTIAASAVIMGVAQLVSNGRTIVAGGDTSVLSFSLGGIVPFQVIVFVVVAAVAWWLHRYTVVGRRVALVGLNDRAAAVSGIRSWPVVVVAFVIAGSLAAVAGSLLAAESGQGNLQLAATMGFDAITAVVVGGISVRGGIGNPLAAAVGAILVGLLSNMLVLVGLSYEVQLIFKGILVLAAVTLTGVIARTPGRTA